MEDSGRLVIVDDGRGCGVPQHVSDLAREGKLGVLGMKERAELVGGSFDFSSVLGQGTRITVVVGPGRAGSA